jgi:antitoxin component YwqK of YwqJK toxin-antitoxin module
MDILPSEMTLYILDYLTYPELKEFALTSDINRFHVDSHMNHIIKMFAVKFPGIVMERHELIERIFHLNSYKSHPNMIKDITIVGNVWKKDRNTISTDTRQEWRLNWLLHRYDGPAHTIWHQGVVISEAWYINGIIHRDGRLPGSSKWNNDGTLVSETWYINGELDYGSTYYLNGIIKSEMWYNVGQLDQEDGELHRDDGPAIIRLNTAGTIIFEQWVRDGLIHRDDGPARITWHSNGAIKSDEWYINNKLHRDGAPSTTSWLADGTKESEMWHIDGKRHRDNGPAATTWNSKGSVKTWYNDGHMM